MSVKLREKNYRLKRTVGEDRERVIIEDTEEIPEETPGVLRIIDIETEVELEDIKTAEERTIVEGVIGVRVIYEGEVAEEEGGLSISVFDFAPQPFTGFVSIPEMEPDLDLSCELNVASVEVTPVEEGKLKKSVIIDILARAEKKETLELIIDAAAVPPEQVEVKQSEYTLEDMIGEDTEEVIVSLDYEIPEDYPPIDQILSTRCEAVIDEHHMQEGSLSIEGTIEGKILYLSDQEEPSVYVLSFEPEKFDAVLDIQEAQEGMQAAVSASITDVTYKVSGEREVEESVAVELTACVYSIEEAGIVVDILPEDKHKLDVSKKTVVFDEIIGEAEAEELVEAQYFLAEGDPELTRILDMRTETSLTAVETAAGRVKVEGTVACKVAYEGLAYEDEGRKRLAVARFEKEFSAAVQVTGAKEGMDPLVDVDIAWSDIEVVNERTIEAQIQLKLAVRVIQEQKLEAVTDVVSLSPSVAEDKNPTFLFYVVQPSDTLYKISRRFNTDEELISAVNELEDPEEIEVGQKLYIPQK